jgi:simple sugar transport system ATP-binding protein|tara:strand:- start:5189 stop:6724 length:1536 start_codon:yes stop_codon:yes gene_type:complete
MMSKFDTLPAATAVELSGIWKRFPGVVANAGASLSVSRGSIHAVLGENGAGKSTLMNVLAGVYRPDEGEVRVEGVEHRFRTPADALASGIGMVHQEFRLVPSFTVAENVVLGAAARVLRRQAIEDEVGELAERFGLATRPERPVWQLSMGERQRVEILKALWRDARILILDEPTAVLTPAEADELGVVLRAMADAGRSVIFISHKLHEVTGFCDEATVLRGGRTVAASMSVPDTDAGELASLMVGSLPVTTERPPAHPTGPPLLEVSGLSALGDRGLPALESVDLTVRAGEIVGIAGVAGNGQRELCQVVSGLRPAKAGTVHLAGDDMTGASPRRLFQAGLGYIPEDRLGVGLAPRLSVIDNSILRTYEAHRRGPFIVADRAEAHCADLVERFGVRTGPLDEPMAGLSGGNLQRLLVGRELSGRPRVVMAAQPTRGLDVQGVKAIQDLLVEAREAGAAVLLVSEDLDELLTLADRLVVMHDGEIVGEFDPTTAARSEIGEAMIGHAAGVGS